MNPAEELPWAIIVHGGAKEIEVEQEDRHRRGCERAVLAGQEILRDGGSAIDAVHAAILVFETDATFNAGYGSVQNADGVVQCDAAIMDGATLRFGGVAALSGVRHPISVAAALLAEEPILLVGEGAERFARESGAEMCEPHELIAPTTSGSDPGADTVGCVAMDANGHVAAGASTGGLSGTMPGRVGDSPLPGCGLFAEAIGAVALSGEGESIARVTLAAWSMNALSRMTPAEASEAALERLEVVAGQAGIIAMNAAGEVGWAHSSRDFAVAHARSDSPVRAFLRRQEEEE